MERMMTSGSRANLRPHIKNVKAAVMTVGGWFDAEDLFGALAVYRSVEKNSPNATNTLVMGPLVPRRMVARRWRSPGQRRVLPENFRVLPPEHRAAIPQAVSQGPIEGDELPKAYVFETGTDQWRRYSAWPPKSRQGRRSLFPRERPALLLTRPPPTNPNSTNT